MSNKKFDKSSFELYGLLSQPVIVMQEGKEVYRNSAAKGMEIQTEELLEHEPPFETAVTIGEASYQVSVRPADDFTVLILNRIDPENSELLAAVGVYLRESLTGLTVAAQHFGEDLDIIDQRADRDMSMVRHSILSIQRAAINLQYLGEASSYAEMETMDLGTTLFELTDSVNVLTMGKRAKIVYTEDEKRKNFYGSLDLIERIMLNLLSNSMKAAPKDSIIRVRCEAKGKKAIITVSDEGGGLSDEMMDSLFTSYKLPRNIPDMNRLGLGLAVTRKMVQKMGGTIFAMNRRPEGADFVITLPLTDSPLTVKSPIDEYHSKGMTRLQSELSSVLDYHSYSTKYSD